MFGTAYPRRKLIWRAMMLLAVTGLVAASFTRPAGGQIVTPTPLATGGTSTGLTKIASLSDQLINRLRATTAGRQDFVREVVRRTENGTLDARLVLAIQRYAIRRNPEFPFPFFERALRFQAAKSGVVLPEVQLVARPVGAR